MTDTIRPSSKSLRHPQTTPLVKPKTRRVQRWFLLFGTLVIGMLVSGCVSTAPQGDTEPWAYNVKTGYPAVGGPRWLGW